MRLRIVSVAAIVVALTATSAGAHDYWLEFQPLAPAVDQALALSLWVGEDFVAEAEKAMQRDRTVSLRHLHRGGDEDLRAVGREGAAPLLEVPLKTPGGHLLSLERDPSHIVLRARKFNRYLEHEGLSSILDERRRTHQRLRRARERYTRYLKAFVQVGDAADGVSTRPLGHRLELVPDRDLAALRPGDRLGVRLLFEGAPVAGAQVEAFVKRSRGGPATGQAAITDGDGRIEVAIGEAGAWLVRTVHMQRCEACDDADWESFWTSYSFAVR
ncbi:MAG: DUF4198 domain-containing protein [Nannocystaceae bacterium]